ncbi:MAG TPA: hypothetical protein VJJ51_01900 [Candidatus Methanoperedens sp.]|nr:hypothetical protein [Candidatus Methanoperedens sp.]
MGNGLKEMGKNGKANFINLRMKDMEVKKMVSNSIFELKISFLQRIDCTWYLRIDLLRQYWIDSCKC